MARYLMRPAQYCSRPFRCLGYSAVSILFPRIYRSTDTTCPPASTNYPPIYSFPGILVCKAYTERVCRWYRGCLRVRTFQPSRKESTGGCRSIVRDYLQRYRRCFLGTRLERSDKACSIRVKAWNAQLERRIDQLSRSLPVISRVSRGGR